MYIYGNIRRYIRKTFIKNEPQKPPKSSENVKNISSPINLNYSF